jgi:hypothetical protein
MKKRILSIVVLLGAFMGQGFANDEQKRSNDMWYEHIEGIRTKHQDEEMDWLIKERENAVWLISECKYEIAKKIALLQRNLTEDEMDKAIKDKARELFVKDRKIKKLLKQRKARINSRVSRNQENKVDFSASRLIELQNGLKFLEEKIEERRNSLESNRIENNKRLSTGETEMDEEHDEINEFLNKRKSWKQKQDEVAEGGRLSEKQLEALRTVSQQNVAPSSQCNGLKKFFKDKAKKLKNAFQLFWSSITSIA